MLCASWSKSNTLIENLILISEFALTYNLIIWHIFFISYLWNFNSPKFLSFTASKPARTSQHPLKLYTQFLIISDFNAWPIRPDKKNWQNLMHIHSHICQYSGKYSCFGFVPCFLLSKSKLKHSLEGSACVKDSADHLMHNWHGLHHKIRIALP